MLLDGRQAGARKRVVRDARLWNGTAGCAGVGAADALPDHRGGGGCQGCTSMLPYPRLDIAAVTTPQGCWRQVVVLRVMRCEQRVTMQRCYSTHRCGACPQRVQIVYTSIIERIFYSVKRLAEKLS